jgi:sugar lactone lactonase YvrE
MSGKTHISWWQSIRFALTGVALICLAIFLAQKTSRPVNPSESTLPRNAASEAASNAAPATLGKQALSGERTPHRLAAQSVLKYGVEEGAIGMVNENGKPPVGPESFTIMKDGSILVADVLNQRIAVYSSKGTYLRTIRLPGIALGDVMADAQGRVYAYDQDRHALYQYDAQGTPQSVLNLSPSDIDTRGYFHLVGNSVYFADAAVRDVLVASLQGGVLTPADKSLERTTAGIHGDSGRIYSMSLDKGQGLRLQVRDPAAASAAQSIDLPLAGIVSARYAGEDQMGRFYVQTERMDGTRIAMEVLAFSPNGEPLAATRMPENDYAVWTAKLVDIGSDGTIVQFLPQRNQAKLNVFAN